MPTLLATTIGLGVNNGRAVIEALIGYKSGFARTPKSGDAGKDSLYKSYQSNSQNWATYLELVLGSVYLGFLLWAIAQAYWIVVPFLSLFAIGFFYTGLMSLRQSWSQESHKKPLLISDNEKKPSDVVKPQKFKEASDTLIIAE